MINCWQEGRKMQRNLKICGKHYYWQQHKVKVWFVTKGWNREKCPPERPMKADAAQKLAELTQQSSKLPATSNYPPCEAAAFIAVYRSSLWFWFSDIKSAAFTSLSGFFFSRSQLGYSVSSTHSAVNRKSSIRWGSNRGGARFSFLGSSRILTLLEAGRGSHVALYCNKFMFAAFNLFQQNVQRDSERCQRCLGVLSLCLRSHSNQKQLKGFV